MVSNGKSALRIDSVISHLCLSSHFSIGFSYLQIKNRETNRTKPFDVNYVRRHYRHECHKWKDSAREVKPVSSISFCQTATAE
ncbi:Hypothetical predicted protein [Octopus vulgaris]|uniref:Uncharacterized protein n=1 Tax=Octopus vulgaris TaxID=6645 RepID=A0AA36F6Y2_OCTVU|nr:Hypothetical predicted protein [Octopus vulgaris]